MKTFELNSKIELIREDKDCTSGLIYDIGDDKLYVSIPPAARDFKILRQDEVLQGVIYLKDQLLGFDCIVSQRIFGDSPIYELSDLGNFTRVQRRNNIRVPHTNQVFYTGNKYILDMVDKEEYPEQILPDISKYLKEGMMLDISGGGMKFSCNEDFTMGSSLSLVFTLCGETLILKGEIVHKEINILPKQTKYAYGIKYLDIDNKLKERIIQFTFILMRKNRMK